MKLSKTNYLIYKDCAKNAWLKINKSEVYFGKPLSAFEEGIIETGNEVDSLARDLFPGGIVIEDRNDIEGTKKLVENKESVIYQPVFETSLYKMISDMFVWNKTTNSYDLYEVKASNSGESKGAKDKLYVNDIGFQYLILKELNIPIGKLYLVRLNSKYIREAELDIHQLFSIEDFTDRVMGITENLSFDMKSAYEILSSKDEPKGNCKCIIRGRSSHCTTFSYSNPEVPEYSVHDISRIGSSKKKLADLVDSGIYDIKDVPEDFPLSEKQQNQIIAVQTNKISMNKNEIFEFLDTIKKPISFLDYETFAAGIPRYNGYSPFNQIPFQFSLHIVNTDEDVEPSHDEFLYVEKNKNPDVPFILAMKKYLPKTGSIIVWYKSFEMSRNKDLAKRNPEYKEFLEDVNSRVIDLMDVFTNQHFIHPKFKGKTSIKYVLPVLAPELSYKALDIQEGGTASNTWNEIVTDGYSEKEAKEKIKQLKIYCGLDTYAMYKIWDYLRKIK